MSTPFTRPLPAAPTRRPADRPLRARGERGAVLVYTAILGLLLIGILGLALDSAYVLTTAQQLQHAADAAALAGVRLVKAEADPLNASNEFPVTRHCGPYSGWSSTTRHAASERSAVHRR